MEFPKQLKSLVLCPLKPELKSLLAGLTEAGVKISSPQAGLHIAEDLKTGLALCGHSKARFAANASRLLTQNSQFENLFCCGTSGSINEVAKPLDVVVGKVSVEHDFHSMFIKVGKLPHYESSTLELLKDLSFLENDSYQTHVAGIASGNEDIVTRDRALEIARNTQCIAVAWEGAGGAVAAEVNGVNYLEIRCISDVCDENVESEFMQNLPQGMKNCSKTLLKVLQQLLHQHQHQQVF